MQKFGKKPAVVIIGAGPVGLAAAIELGGRGVECLILEKSERAGYAPRAKTTHSRTREHMRRWGIAEKLADASPFGVDYPTHILFVTRLAGELLWQFEWGLDGKPENHPHYSEHGQWIPQYKLEAVLREHVETMSNVTLVFGQEYVGHTQHENGVDVRIRASDTGQERTIPTEYMIGADGGNSTVRDHIGSKMHGKYGLSYNFNIIFRAPGLADKHPHGPGIMYWQINNDVPSVIGPMDKDDLWFFMPFQVEKGMTVSDEEAADMISRSTGIDMDYEILSSDEWVASRLLADKYREGRVFLAGDACHLHPPLGGFGMNLGVSDAVDLGWKLAAVLKGWGGSSLLDSYAIERKIAHEIVLDAAEANHTVLANQLVVPEIENKTQAGLIARQQVAERIVKEKSVEFYARGVVLGYCYKDSPIVLDDGTQKEWERSIDYTPKAIPGCIAPHLWLEDGSSLYDHFGVGLTLLVMAQGHDAAVERLVKEASSRQVPLKVLPLFDPTLQDLYQAEMAIIRPDQHIAWRGSEPPGHALDKLLGH